MRNRVVLAEAAFFERCRPLADIMFPFRGRRSEPSIVTTAGLTIFVAMSADRHCWNGNGVILPRHPHDIHAPDKKSIIAILWICKLSLLGLVFTDLNVLSHVFLSSPCNISCSIEARLCTATACKMESYFVM